MAAGADPQRTRVAVCIGSRADPLIDAVADTVDSPVVIDEQEAFTATPFALHLRDGAAAIRLDPAGRTLDDEELAGVLVRPTPGVVRHDHSDPATRQFLHHESMAAWHALLFALGCPVANRLPLEWWWCDDAVPGRLGASLELAAGPIPVEARGASAYLAGPAVVPAAGGNALGVALAGRAAEVREWQAASGTLVARVDVMAAGEVLVDPVPDFTAEDVEVVARVARGVAEAFA